MTEFRRLLVANRGEIAVRIMRTARALGLRTVAVYSDIDRDSPHVALADRAVAIGSYLAIEQIIAAVRLSGADAIHPGYGFLSESAAFAQACVDAGLVFVGPPVEAIALMGNKAAAKRRMAAAGVPCVPGHDDGAQDDRALARAALNIGLPVMIKAAAGGGGKGMRLVTDQARLEDALRAARSEAEKAFGSGELILEKAIAAPRHVEIQVFADRHGNVIHLGERDCSIQRRHQKVIEEAPSPALDPALRQRMGETAVAAARAISYVGAGTIEFLLAPDEKFYFLEMNTRLQVEHPVTEMVTGLDLVEWQLRVAAGGPLRLRQEDVALGGHAIEARLYAEDTHGDFLPQAGAVLAWEPPTAAGVRVDHALAAGLTVSPHYDPMLAKVIAHGATREEARRRLVAALEDLVVLGTETNRDFLIECLQDEAFRAGDVTTAFIETRFPPARRARRQPGRDMQALAAVLIDRHGQVPTGAPLSPWRNAGASSSPVLLEYLDGKVGAQVVRNLDGSYRVDFGDERHDVALVAIDGTRVRFLAGGLQRTARFAFDRDILHLSLDGVTATFADVLLARHAGGDGRAGDAALAPMTGTIAAVRVAPGDSVRKGQCLVILEAMKMEHEIAAPRDGTVAAVRVAVGQQVTTRKVLVELARTAAE
jgi:geranyl-CoA carboxylase alpha subunit